MAAILAFYRTSSLAWSRPR